MAVLNKANKASSSAAVAQFALGMALDLFHQSTTQAPVVSWPWVSTATCTRFCSYYSGMFVLAMVKGAGKGAPPSGKEASSWRS